MTIHMNYVLKHGVATLKGRGDYAVLIVEVISIVQNIVLKLGKDKQIEQKMIMVYIWIKI